MTPLVLILGERTRPLGERIAAAIDGELVLSASGEVAGTLRTAFREGRSILGVCSAGILIRALAPVLADKRSEPPVLAVAADGRAVVPLLGGHRGANLLAEQLAQILAGSAAITTASETSLGLALDDPPPGWRLATHRQFQHFTAARLAGKPVRLTGHAPWLQESGLRFEETARDEIIITHRTLPAEPHRLLYHPAVLALGVGAERGASAPALSELVRATLAENHLSPLAVAGIFSIDLKAAEPAVHALAHDLGVPARFFSAQELEAETPRLANPSALVFAETGCHGVAEGAALAAAGAEAELLVAKRIGARCTCAIALAPQPIDPATAGRPQGRLALLGIGPGSPASRTAETIRHIRDAEDIVGYRLYLELIGDLVTRQRLHAYALGEETERCRQALDLAAEGRRVVLVSSGDSGIYGMAALVMELLATADTADNAAWHRIDLEICPGVSAMQAAAARAGAVLGHDFCAISLSDLMTPWPVIEQRLEAAAAGDFVVALYNPVSARRREGFAQALTILSRARSATTPVILARNLGRTGETVRIRTLGDIQTDEVDMLTIVIIGSAETRTIPRLHGPDWVFTPRGYGA